MAEIVIKWADANLKRFDNQLKALGKDAPKALQRAVARAGDSTRTQVVRALTKQTGLPRATIVRAIKTRRPSWTDFTYTMTTTGGDISLKYFQPRETAKGVTAKPFGKRDLFEGSFLKGGKWPNRAEKMAFGGHAFHRVGSGRLPVEMTKSKVIIPDEMVKGETEAAFREHGMKMLEKRVAHEIGRLLK